MNNNQRVYQSSTFEIINPQNVLLYKGNLKDNEFTENLFKKTISVLKKRKFLDNFFISQNEIYFFSRNIKEEIIPIIFEDKKYDFEFNISEITEKRKFEIFFDILLSKDKNLIKIKNNLFLMPFERFYMLNQRNQNRYAIQPLFCYEILNHQNIIYICIKINFYSENYLSLEDALNKKLFIKKSDDFLIFNLYNHSENYFYFDCLVKDEKNIINDSHFHKNENNNFVKLTQISNNKEIIRNTLDVNLWERLKYDSFQLEKVYLTFKIRKLLYRKRQLIHFNLNLHKKTYQAQINLFNPNTTFSLNITENKDDSTFENWGFFCLKNDIINGQNLIKIIFGKFKTLFPGKKINTPKCFFIDKNENDIVQNYRNAICNKFKTNNLSFVLLLINEDVDYKQKLEIETFLSKNKIFSFMMNSNEIINSRINLQNQIDMFSMEYKKNFFGRFQILFKFPKIFHFVKLEIIDSYFFVTLNSFSVSNEMIIDKKILKLKDFNELSENFNFTIPYQYTFFLNINKSSEKIIQEYINKNNQINMSFALLKKSSFNIYPNINISPVINDSKLSITNYKNYIFYERYFNDKFLEESYHKQFIYFFLNNELYFLNVFNSYRVVFYKDNLAQIFEDYQVLLKFLHILQSIYKNLDFILNN